MTTAATSKGHSKKPQVTIREVDWTKPQAMAIPKDGYFTPEQGRYGVIFPKTPACYGFTIVAKIIPGREPVFYEYAKNIEQAVTDQPDCLAVLKLHYLRWVLFPINGETYFMYQGIFDTDFDKYTEDAVSLFTKLGLRTVFENLRGLSHRLADERAGIHQIRSRAPVSKLPGIRRVPVRQRR
jgi:hypothetical protein